MKKINWGYPTTSLEKANRKLRRDMKFYGAGGAGDCAMLDLRHPRIVRKIHKDKKVWYHIEVDDLPLPLEFR